MNSYNSMLMGLGAADTYGDQPWLGTENTGSGGATSSPSFWDTLNKVTENVLKPGAEIYSNMKNSANASANQSNVPSNNLPPLQSGGMPTALKVAAGVAVVTGVGFVLYQVFKPKKKG